MKTTASAPGKVILFGEHAVVFGKPAIATALSLRTVVSAEPATTSTINGIPLRVESNPYPYHALELTGNTATSLNVKSDIPPGAGLGSSAALSVAIIGAMRTSMEAGDVAEKAFEVELRAQGRASPIDTSTATHGKGVYVDRREGDDFLWSISRKDVVWNIHHIEVPSLKIVVGYTGEGAPTGPLVENVRRLHSRFETARNAIDEIGAISEEARRKLIDRDIVALGELMDRNQRLLSVVGVSSGIIERLIDAVRPFCYGAKLTGAGGGGSIITLTDKPDKVSEAIRKRGFIPIDCSIGGNGLEVEKSEG